MIEEKIESLGIKLPAELKTIGSYVPVVITSNNLVFVSGQIPLDSQLAPVQLRYKGKVGKSVSIDDARHAAKLCVINALGHIRSIIGTLDNIKKFVKISGFVNCESSFTDHPKVINGASDFILEVFGEKGRHTRVAVGTNSLPLDSPVEVDMIVEIY